tara:strand:+ start:159 stop:377 length:219 start_codon:yes stop_codon:yes gene_type:complete
MNEYDLRIAIKNSETFKSYPRFKQGITLSVKNVNNLHDLYGQASRLGIDYLKQNPNILSSDLKLIAELIEKK